MSIQRGEVMRALHAADKPLGVRELMKQGGFHPGQQTDLKRVLRELVRSGDVEKEGKRYLLPGGPPQVEERRPARGKAAAPRRPEREAPRSAKGRGASSRGGKAAAAGPPKKRLESLRQRDDVVEGILHVHKDGFGFVHPIGDKEQENIFLPPDEASRALDGDRVIVQVVEGRGGRTAGQLLEVVDRVRERAVGEYQEEGRRAFVVPSDRSLKGRIYVPPTQLARPGDMVKVVLGIGRAVIEPGVELFGEVVGSVGRPGEPSAEVLSVAYSQGFSDEFPAEVMAEADAYALRVSDEEAKEEGRRDLRTLPLLTIDGEDARDFDDAVYAEPTRDGWRLVVAIADVTQYVREGMALDAEALRRGTSVYLPDRVLPMLPERLSNGICSLRPEEDRLCMVADMLFDGTGGMRSYELYPAVMRSVARCTYNEVQAVLDGRDVPHRNVFRPHFENLWALARVLMGMRKRRGAIDFDLAEYKVILGEDGTPERMDKRERIDAHRLIEECMLAANEAVAKFFQKLELPSVYRFHGEPDEEKLEIFASLARAYGFELGTTGEIRSHDLNKFLVKLEGHPEKRALNQLLLRSMMQAVYSAENVGHYGLGAEHYLHFTSPIRRYPDLLVHRLLKKHWARGAKLQAVHQREQEEARLEEMAVQCSERERAAVSVEREVVSYYATLLMKDRVGETFDATVAGIADFGFFVELKNEHVEGLVKLESVGFGASLDTNLHALVWPDGRRVKVGQELSVRLIAANVERRQLEFEAVAFAGEEPLERPVRGEGDEQFGRPRRFGGPQGQRGRPPFDRDRERGRGGGRPGRPGRPGRSEREERAPRTAPPAMPWQKEEERTEDSRSPHPGFDRLRALAAQKGGGRAAEGRGAGKKDRGSSRGRGSASGGGRGEGAVERDKFGNPKRKPHGGGGGPRKGGGGGGGKKGKGGRRR